MRRPGDRRRPARRRTALATALAAVGLTLAAGACGGSSDGGDAAADGDGRPTVLTIEDFAFRPEPLVVPAGTVVRVVNQDDAAHTATADDGSFDTGELAKGGTAEVRLAEGGEVAYHCAIHDYMRGVIRVGN